MSTTNNRTKEKKVEDRLSMSDDNDTCMSQKHFILSHLSSLLSFFSVACRKKKSKVDWIERNLSEK